MTRRHVYEIAKERGITSKEALEVLRRAGLNAKRAASKVEAEEAVRAFSSGGAPVAVAEGPARRTPKTGARTAEARSAAGAEHPGGRLKGMAEGGAAGARERMRLNDFIAWVEGEQPGQLSVMEVARVSPRPWFTRNGSGKRARIRLPVGEQKYERMQGDDHWHRVDHWTMGPPR